jgi:ABC-type nitrate/sulfonate/bicarbonate transport system permease component
VAVASSTAKPGFSLSRVLRSPRTARLLFPLALLAVWQIAFEVMDSQIFPAPAEVLNFMWDEIRLDTLSRYTLYESFGISLGRLLTGFAVAMLVGTAIGLAMGLSKSVYYFLYDIVVVLLAMPSLVWALLTGLLFGLGNQAPIVTVIMAGIPFVILNVLEGVRNSPKDLYDMARSFDVPQSGRIRHVLIPSLMPFFFAALRYGFANGWKGLVLAEVFAATNGAGWTIRFWYDAHRAHGVLGYALFFILFALFIERGVFERLSRRVFRWRPSLGAPEVVEEAVAGTGKRDVADAELEESDAGRN